MRRCYVGVTAMIQMLSTCHRMPALLRTGLSAGLGISLALAALSPAPALAAAGQHERLDRETRSAMSVGAAVDVILVAQAGLPELYADLRHAGIKQAVRVPIAHGVAARLTASQVSFFASDPRVDRIIYDAPVQLSDTPFDPGALASLYPQVVDAAASWSNRPSPLTGNGIGIAVIDSGIAAHPDLAGRVVTSKDFNPNVNDASDTYGHGTAVAGIIAGDGTASGGAYVGVAPRASLINIRVNDGTGAAPTSAIMNALLWATVNRKTYNIRVINLSLQASVQESYQTSPLDAAVEYAWLKGILVVVAAGNKGPNSELYAPANDPYVITVGATDDRGTRTIADDTLAAFSSYGVTQDGFSKPDLVAPGRHIVTTLAAGSAFAVGYPGNLVGSRYIQLSGSSMAAPQVSGVAALYLEAHPSIGPSQLKGVLRATANKLALPGIGAGYPDAGRAIAYRGTLGNANAGLQPNNYLKVMYMQARGFTTLPTVSWDSVSWDSVSWDSVSWTDIAWNAVSWSS